MAIAHTKNSDGEYHDLQGHLQGVAERARDFAGAFGAATLGYFIGMAHDLGKYHPDFQKYLYDVEQKKVPKGGPDHKAAGALLAQQLQVPPLALLVQGHHGGLKSPTEFRAWFASRQPRAQQALATARTELGNQFPATAPVIPPAVMQNPYAAEFFCRMLFSALVDADYLDTEAHSSAVQAERRGTTSDITALLERFTANHAELTQDAPDTLVNRIRRELFDQCVRAGQSYKPGLFRLTIPTGGGKTRAGMAFALHHAQTYGLRRVIVAVPFISITEQTAAVYRDIFGNNADGTPIVLEHHSGRAEPTTDPDEYDPAAEWTRLAAENWDATIVVTTTVQLFESLFANHTGKCRKLHRLANSVIILDEVQAFPPHLLTPMLDALQLLCQQYGSTIVLSTATQPAFDALPPLQDVPITEIVPDPTPYFAALRRVTYDWSYVNAPLEWDQVAEMVRAESQALVVLNTKRDAIALMEVLGSADHILHLSTLLCGAHRLAVIQEVRQRLKQGVSCWLIATQVIEAGVDLDFPTVLRAMGPLDSIIQVAGRCNREGRRQTGNVIVFTPADGRVPRNGSYEVATNTARAMLSVNPDDPNDATFLRQYYTELFGEVVTDLKNVQESRRNLDYPETAKRFRMIDQLTYTAIIQHYGNPATRQRVAMLITAIQRREGNLRLLLRQLQPYTVSIPHYLATPYQQEGFIAPLQSVGMKEPFPDLGIWSGTYHPTLGIQPKGAPPEEFMF